MPIFLKITAFFAVLLLLSSFSVPKKRTIVNLKHGSQLIYDVDAGNAHYNLTVTIKKIKPELSFSYETSGPNPKKGSITIPAKDIDSARSLNNDFGGGNKDLDGETSIFLSRTIYAEVAMAGMTEGGTSFKANSNETMENFTKGEPNQNEIKVNNKIIQIDGERFYDYVDEKHGNYHYAFTIMKSENYPLILDMNLGWILHLKEMKDVEVVVMKEE